VDDLKSGHSTAGLAASRRGARNPGNNPDC
jgi:hypothetical protein